MKSMYEFEREDAFRFANSVGAKTRVRGNELQFMDCPYCHGASRGDKNTFSINLDNGTFNCMRASCGVHGNMITISKDFDFSLGDEADEYFRGLKRYKQLIQTKVDSKPIAIQYLERRGIPEAVTRKYEITAKGDSTSIIVFPFRDDKGKLQFVKYRNISFQKGDKGAKEWCEENCRPILFGMNLCDPGTSRTLVMTEGQIDSLSCAAAGIQNAVSVPTGKNGFTWVRYCWDFLGKFETLIIFGDHERGEITLLEEMKVRFNGTVKHVRVEDYRDCKDANEILQKYGPEQIRKCVENAIPVPVELVQDMADVADEDPFKIEKLATGIKELDAKLHGGLPFGNVHVLGGKRGDGKSTFGSQLIASALRQHQSCFIYSGELQKGNVKSWLDSQIAGPRNIIVNKEANGSIKNWFVSKNNRAIISEWYRGRCYIYDGDQINEDEREDLLKTVEEVIQQNGVRVVLLDNLMTALDLTIQQNTDKYEKQSYFVKRLARIARRYNACIILVAHRRKSNGFDNSDSNDEISGSGDITNLAGVVLSYDRLSKRDLDDCRGTDKDRKLIIAKERLFGNVDFEGIILHYEILSKRIYGDGDDDTEDYGWDFTGTADTPEDDYNPFEDGGYSDYD